MPSSRYSAKGELKVVDLASTTFACDTTGSVTCLNLTAQGDDLTNRIGRQITAVSVRILGILLPSGVPTNPTFARIMLIWDSQSSGQAIPAITDILNASTSITSTNLNNRERFTVLRDHTIALGAVNNTATQTFAESPSVSQLDWFVKLKGLKTIYNATTGASVAVITSGSLLLLTIGDQAAGDGVAFQATSRFRFTDL